MEAGLWATMYLIEWIVGPERPIPTVAASEGCEALTLQEAMIEAASLFEAATEANSKIQGYRITGEHGQSLYTYWKTDAQGT